jgi:hypothetical protein
MKRNEREKLASVVREADEGVGGEGRKGFGLHAEGVEKEREDVCDKIALAEGAQRRLLARHEKQREMSYFV